mgnify:FL=1
MRRHVQEPGIRKWSGTDLIELENEPLKAIDGFFCEYGDMVIKGCEVDRQAGRVSEGLVGLSGKDPDGNEVYRVCPFRGASGIPSFPVYLVLRYSESDRTYADGVTRPIAYDYEAELLYERPTDRPFLPLGDDGKNRFVDKIQDEGHRMVSDSDRKKWDDGLSGAGHSHAQATTAKPGFMSAVDKMKVDKIDGDYSLIPAITIPLAVNGLTGEEDYDGVMTAFGGKEKFDGIVNGVMSGAFLVFSKGVFVSADAGMFSGNTRYLYMGYQNTVSYSEDIVLTSLKINVSHENRFVTLKINKDVRLKKKLEADHCLVDPLYVSDDASLVRYLERMGGFKGLYYAVKDNEPFSFYSQNNPYEQIFPIRAEAGGNGSYKSVDIYTMDCEKNSIVRTTIRDENGSFENLSRTITKTLITTTYVLPSGLIDLTEGSTSGEIERAVGGESGLRNITQAIKDGNLLLLRGDIGGSYRSVNLSGGIMEGDNGDIQVLLSGQSYGLWGGLYSSTCMIEYSKDDNTFSCFFLTLNG